MNTLAVVELHRSVDCPYGEVLSILKYASLHPVPMHLVYCGLRVREIERSVRFYTEGLGLREVHRGKMNHGGVFIELEDLTSHQRIELNWYPSDSKFNVPYREGEELDHLGFDVDDVHGCIRKLVALGGSLAIEPWIEKGTNSDYLIGYVKDPDGIWIEVFSEIASPRS
ncbi:MAG: VOC family protein [Candidatus Thermoplasmatota archaeon]|nr:VOC family protein [Candidatus Thermoplasmatota archaeon]